MAYALPAAMGGIGAAAGFMSPNYKQAYDQYAQSMQNIAGNYNPYIRGGAGAEGGLAALGIHNLADPAGLENRLAASYKDSPYQTQMATNLSNKMNTNAALTGMIGSTAQQTALQNSLAGQENQFQQQYINRGMQQYGQNLQNLQALGMMMGQQGFGAMGQKQGMLQEGALGTLKGAMAPSQLEQALIGGAGAFEGALPAHTLGY